MKKTISIILCAALLASLFCFAVLGANKKNAGSAEKSGTVPENYKYLIDNNMILPENYADGGFWTFEHSGKNVTAIFTLPDLTQNHFTYTYKNYREPGSGIMSRCVPCDRFLASDAEGNLYFSSSVSRTKNLFFGWSYLCPDKCVLVKCSSEGNFLWSKYYDTSEISAITNLCILESGEMLAGGLYITKSFNGERKNTAVLLSADGEYIKNTGITQTGTEAFFVPYNDGAAVINDSTGNADGIAHTDADICLTDERILKGFSIHLKNDISPFDCAVFEKKREKNGKAYAAELYSLSIDGETAAKKELSLGEYTDYSVYCIENSSDILIRFTAKDGSLHYKLYNCEFKCKGAPEIQGKEIVFAMYDGDNLLTVSTVTGEKTENAEIKENMLYTYFDKNTEKLWQYTSNSDE